MSLNVLSLLIMALQMNGSHIIGYVYPQTISFRKIKDVLSMSNQLIV
jgi:hypothetical protein